MNGALIFTDSFNHMKWADHLIWKNIIGSQTIQSDEKAIDLIFHIHLVQNLFINTWLSKEEQIDRKDRSLTNAKILAENFHSKLPMFMETLASVNLEKEMVLPWASMLKRVLGKEPRNTLLHETIMQMIQHTTYHRGQLNKRFREMNEEPVMSDFIYWAWIEKPIVEFNL